MSMRNEGLTMWHRYNIFSIFSAPFIQIAVGVHV
jgi:hypothetical protein